ncbi:hypothetical protein D3C83_163470 [compost metagenome]
MARLFDAFGEQVSRFVFGKIAGVGDGQHRDRERLERAGGVDAGHGHLIQRQNL